VCKLITPARQHEVHSKEITQINVYVIKDLNKIGFLELKKSNCMSG